MQRALGIDLGTTNSVTAYIRRGGPQIVLNMDNRDLTPSVVALGRRRELLVGAAARARPRDSIYSVKRFMGRKFGDADVQEALSRMQLSYRVTEGADGDVRVWLGEREYTPIEISSMILRRLKEDAEKRVGERFTRAVITVPAYFGERQVAATREAGRMAGFYVVRIINEPTAAALAFGLNREADADSKTVLVYDLGGGTFDISVLMMMDGAFTVMGIEGDNLLGGDDFDRSLMSLLVDVARRDHDVDLVGDDRATSVLRDKAEEAKISLSSQLSFDIYAPSIGSEAIDLEVEIPRDRFEEIVRGRIERTVELTQKAIREADLTPDAVDYIVLVGGSTAIPLVAEKLGEVFGPDKIRRDVNPMQGVALGAAIQTALVADLECVSCQARTPIQEDNCGECAAPLYGVEKITCPTCYMLSDELETVCWKCGGRLDGTGAPPAAVVAPPPAAEACPGCGRPYRSGASACTICGTVLTDAGGLECSRCKAVNPPGSTVCSQCNQEMTVTNPFDVTPKDLGIELNDGQLAVLVTKNTPYPTLDMKSRDFYTSVANQRRLEVAVYEGDRPLAQQNELCGLVTISLPEGLPRGSPVNIGFGLDDSRTITVSVKVRAEGGAAKSVRLQRGRIDPERQRSVEECREKVVAFMDQWDKEITAAERRDLHAVIDALDGALIGDASTVQHGLDQLLASSEAIVDTARIVRGRAALLSAVIFGAGKYLRADHRGRLEGFSEQLEAARQQADWAAGQQIALQAGQAVDSLGHAIMMIVHCRAFANQGTLSLPLTGRVNTALRNIDEGMESGATGRVDEGLDALVGLWDEITRELERQNVAPPPISRPSAQ